MVNIASDDAIQYSYYVYEGIQGTRRLKQVCIRTSFTRMIEFRIR